MADSPSVPPLRLCPHCGNPNQPVRSEIDGLLYGSPCRCTEADIVGNPEEWLTDWNDESEDA